MTMVKRFMPMAVVFLVPICGWQWFWDSRQHTQDVHTGVPGQLFLDVTEPGLHTITFGMREDGFEFDAWLMTTDREFQRPEGMDPKPRVKAGQLPEPFRVVEAESLASEPPSRYPQHWGEPPMIQTRDLVPLPGAYGKGSSTLAKWIQSKMDEDQRRAASQLTLPVSSFSLENTNYYLDRGRWAAINPDKHKQAKATSAFPYPSGKYDVTLMTVGENDGRSSYCVAINGAEIGSFEAPLSSQQYEEGPDFEVTWKNVGVGSGDVIDVTSTTGSVDGEESSRARWSGLAFEPADEATRQSVAKLTVSVDTPVKPAGPPLVLPRQSDGDAAVSVSGEMKQWHKITLSLNGPFAHERDNQPNPFVDRCFRVKFSHESKALSYEVPGYFAADGNAGDSGAVSGTVWRAHLSPDEPGIWNYQITFLSGDGVALDPDAVSRPIEPFHGKSGSFQIAASDKIAPDFRASGRLTYVGRRYLQFAGSGDYFLKAGADAPETLLAYADFDGTVSRKKNVPLKSWQAHLRDWKPGDPTWKGGKGKGLIGAINYLSNKGVNVFSFLSYNAGGDGDNVWPFVQRDDKLHYDCSKLDQWGVVFDHATNKGLYLHFKLQENEMDDNRLGHEAREGRVPESLDGGKLGPERKLYCRELIARFAHELALNWNIGEENTQSSQEIRDMVSYLRTVDPYDHHIVLHTFPNQQEKVYRPLLGNQSELTGVSLQNHWSAVHRLTLQWINESAAAGRPWVVANDEVNPASLGVPPDAGYEGHSGKAKDGKIVYTAHDIRKATLWGNLLAGGAGVEYYFGYQLPQNDLICEDYRSRDNSWDDCHIALEFFRNNEIPFWEMANADDLVENPKHDNSCYCLAKPGTLYLVYLPKGGTRQLILKDATGEFGVRWFNPRRGGSLVDGPVTLVQGGDIVSLGNPPHDTDQDWLAVVRQNPSP